MKKIDIKKIIIVILIVIALVSGFNYWKYINSNPYKLKKIGYIKEEISVLLDKLDENEIEIIILKKESIQDLNKIIQEKYFLFKNLDRYVAYKEINNKPLKDVIAIVNTNNDSEFYTNIKETDVTKDTLMLVNKFHHLADTYAPTDIVDISLQYAYENNQAHEITNSAFIRMANDAKEAGINLVINDSYRTYLVQKELYDKEVRLSGKTEADNYVARPGHSEHQTGYALDINEYGMGKADFENTNAYQWLLSNAHKYGFILRYPKDKEYLTGYKFESWHYRYIGTEIATKIKTLDITFDEYYAYYIEE
jgi:zinc D-Ala-D-Ala carboxypeptidase